ELNLTYMSIMLFHCVEVQPDEEVTLQCSNLSSYPVHLFWFRSTNRPNASRISSMVSPEGNVTFYEGFQNGKFSMTSNISVLFLEIKQVDSSDSGLYFCGLPSSEKFTVYGATNLKVQGKLVFIFSLLIHLRQLKRVLSLLPVKKLQILSFIIPNVDSGAMNYAALSFPLRAKIRRSVPQRELEPNVVYAATR
uniref:Ig-like domain-containing protein n=1 Tax=Haplochromis burtoni TaxID=8153 RepID=A0A3Q2WJ43_HAPBU